MVGGADGGEADEGVGGGGGVGGRVQVPDRHSGAAPQGGARASVGEPRGAQAARQAGAVGGGDGARRGDGVGRAGGAGAGTGLVLVLASGTGRARAEVVGACGAARAVFGPVDDFPLTVVAHAVGGGRTRRSGEVLLAWIRGARAAAGRRAVEEVPRLTLPAANSIIAAACRIDGVDGY